MSAKGLTINGGNIPWSFAYKINKLCGGDWNQTVDCFWKARKAEGQNGVQKYIRAGFVPRNGAVPYMLQPSKESQALGGMEKIREWFEGLYEKKKPAATAPSKTAPAVTVRSNEPSSMADILAGVMP